MSSLELDISEEHLFSETVVTNSKRDDGSLEKLQANQQMLPREVQITEKTAPTCESNLSVSSSFITQTEVALDQPSTKTRAKQNSHPVKKEKLCKCNECGKAFT